MCLYLVYEIQRRRVLPMNFIETAFKILNLKKEKMKQSLKILFGFLFAIALGVPASLMAQKDEKDSKEKDKDKDKDKKEIQHIIVTRKNKADKVTIEINGDKVTVNGKPLEDYKDKDGDISVSLDDFKGNFGYNFWKNDGDHDYDNDNDNDNDNVMELFNENSNHAMLGVTTEKAEQGVEIEDITKGSAAEKIGLKEGDVITKIDDKKIEDPDDLSHTIREHKPGDKVTVTYIRDKKEQKVTAELTKWKGVNVFSYGPKDFKMDMGNMDFNNAMPKFKQNWSWNSNGPKLGLSIQDSDEGKGVKVIEVDGESNAEKAGIKEDDVITEVDGKAVNSADEIAKIIKESKDKISVMIKLLRGGKTMNIEVKMPRKLKTADL